MAWDCYPLVFRLLSPLHIGRRKVGNLQQTRPYVSGKVVWAALTARLTRQTWQGNNNSAYQTIGRRLLTEMRFSYLWPSLEPPTPYFPWLYPNDFDYNLLGGFTSTARNDSQNAAKDGSLHETEFISHFTRTGSPVFLVGCLWVQQSFTETGWQKAIREISLGGERGYGWGRVRLENELNKTVHPSIPDPENFTWQGRISAHLRATPNPPPNVQGEIEPLVGWEMNIKGSMELTSDVIIAYAPGSEVLDPTTLSIGKFGIWQYRQ